MVHGKAEYKHLKEIKQENVIEIHANEDLIRRLEAIKIKLLSIKNS
jgi:hypothetical protein